MTPINLIWVIKPSPPAQNSVIQQRQTSWKLWFTKMHTIHSIISLKTFTYKIRTLMKSNYATRREEDSCNSRQLLLWKFSEIKRMYPLQLQDPYWHYEFLLLHEKDNQVWAVCKLSTSWVRVLSSFKNWTAIK